MDSEDKLTAISFGVLLLVLAVAFYIRYLEKQEKAEMFKACIQQADKAPVLETSFAGHVEACRKVLEEKP
jgi:hypothetical protein